MHTFELSSKRLHFDEVTFSSLLSLTSQNTPNGPISIKMESIDRFTFKNPSQWAYFIVFVDCLAILQKVNVETREDIIKIKDSVNSFLAPSGTSVDDFKVIRVDYCYNTVINDTKMRKCLFELLNKMPAKTNYLRQKTNYIGKKIEYPMGCRRDNKSRGLQIYDKNSERKDESEKIMPYEKNVIRVELQMLPEGLKYRRKADRAPSTFDYWINLDTEKRYLKAAKKIFPKSDFWSFDKAVDIINSSNYKPSMKAKLINYITEVARVKTMDEVSPNLASRQTIKGYIKRLEAINVNPVTIPKQKGIDFIQNPI